MASLANMLDAKMKAADLNFTKAAAAAKVSLPSFRATLAGKSAPNARSVGKYASFLGISAEAVMAAAGKKAGKRGRPPGKAKGPKAKKMKKEGKNSGKKAKRGRPPGKAKGPKAKKGKPGRPKATGPSKGAIRDLFAALKTASSKFNRLLKAAGKLK